MSSVPEKLRIAIFTETFLPKIDGIVSILCLLLQRLQEQGHYALLFGPPGGPSEYAGAEIIGVGGPRLPFYPELHINIPRRRVWERLKTFQPDLIHVVNPVFLGAFGLAYARRLQAPTVASFHTDLPRYAQFYGVGFMAPAIWAYLRALHNRAAVNLCPSTTVRRELQQQGFRRVRWWQRGIDTDLFTPGERRTDVRAWLTDGHPDDFLLINVGRQAPEKRLELLRTMIFPEPNVRLALIGAGPSHEHLRQVFAGTPTVLTGYLRGQKLVDAYRAADAFIFPSTTETFGLVALEAMACRLPVIAAHTGGVLDTVIDGENGLFYDPARPEEMRHLIRQLRDDPALRHRLADNALAHARSRSWRATMDQLVDYYHAAIRVFRFSTPRLSNQAL
ncbi:MAG TPA: glycosyltransferase family 1 protein [Chloroflexi bacterium]|nr:glycosyltransferase family 1 protein [Chloroflexota bacterium]HHW88879.1 glycosyltransferase family 1 protein [Chloroflexota bacterium]